MNRGVIMSDKKAPDTKVQNSAKRYDIDKLERVEVIKVTNHEAYRKIRRSKQQGTDGPARAIWK